MTSHRTGSSRRTSETTRRFLEARDFLLRVREDYETAVAQFRWPQLTEFNWALDYFDTIAHGNGRTALRVINEAGFDTSVSFADLAMRSNQVANFLTASGVVAGDRVLLVLPSIVPLWETMLAVMKLGAVMIPGTPLLETDDLADRLLRGKVKAIVTHSSLTVRFTAPPGALIRVAVGDAVEGWLPYAQSVSASPAFIAAKATRADDLMLIYFTSGTTAKPKLVGHTHQSYPVGHLSTMYWLGLRPGDVHLNLSSPGWAKHAWSCFFAPWNAEATVIAYQFDRFSAKALLDQLERCRVTTFCAPPTVWRMLIQEDLRQWPVGLRELASAGEPLNPDVIEKVRESWGLTVRDGFGQTETTAQIGNSPRQPIKPGSMGRALPGQTVVLVGADGTVGLEGEICLDLSRRPVALMSGYLDDRERNTAALHGGYYRSGDVATSDAQGYITYVGRSDDVFKSSDYRISPFELESVLIEHPAVVEAAVVPSPDTLRLAVPKAYVVLAAGYSGTAATARSILEHVRSRVSPFKRIRRIEFADLPKTISGKIRRVELRKRELAARIGDERGTQEFWEEDLSTGD